MQKKTELLDPGESSCLWVLNMKLCRYTVEEVRTEQAVTAGKGGMRKRIYVLHILPVYMEK